MASMSCSSHPYSVRLEAFFEAAHNLRSYRGEPEPLHGHSWKVEVEVSAPELDAEGMAMDFVELRAELERVSRQLDCTYINEVPPFTDLAPSAENIAQWFASELQPFLRRGSLMLREVRVFEGRHASAAYRPTAS